VEPQTLKGFQDLLPSDMIPRNTVVEKIRSVYERYGFLPLDTPVLEYLVTLVGTGGEETNKQLFRLESPEREPIAMRFDLTVPFARLIAQYPDRLKLPFRRYHIGPVFRADKPGPGRFRQFTQVDIDVAGPDSLAVDAEIVAVMCDVMRECGLGSASAAGGSGQDFQIRINNRKLVDAVLEGSGISERETQKHVLRVVDKLQKVGVDNVRRELGKGRVDESGDPIRGVGLPSELIDQVLGFISLSADSRENVVAALGSLLPDSARSRAAVEEMAELAAALKSLDVSESDAIFDPSLTRGLDYYTGPVFEAYLPSAPQFGSVMGGGRYDQLVERFLDTSIPATGASIGLDRFMAALMHAGIVQPAPTTTKVLVLSMGDTPITELLGVATTLRRSHISTEVYAGARGASVRDQLSFANANGIPVAVLLGGDEIKNNTVSVKDLKLGMEQRAGIQDREAYRKSGRLGQVTVDRGDLVGAVREMLERQQP
jgi:histidyl-tRNA synthetase